MMRLLRKKKSGFSLIESLIAIWAMVIAAAAILSAFVSSSQLRVFSENFTIGINACQKELEDIRFRYQDKQLTFNQLIDNYESGDQVSFNVLNEDGTVNPDFGGRIVSGDPWSTSSSQAGRFVEFTARVAFRQGRRIIGGDEALVPAADTPCQAIMTIVRY